MSPSRNPTTRRIHCGRGVSDMLRSYRQRSITHLGAVVLTDETVRRDNPREVAHPAADEADQQGHDANHISDELVVDEGGPATVLKQIDDRFATGDVGLAVDRDVDESPLVEVLEDVLEAAEEADNAARQEVAISAVVLVLGHRAKGADDRYQQGAEADTA